MRFLVVFCLALVNAGAFSLLAPTTGDRVYEAIGLDPGSREFGGWLLFASAQFLLLIISNHLVASLHSDERQYRALRKWYDDAVQERDALVKQAQLCGEGPMKLASRVARLRRQLRKTQQQCEEFRRKSHRQDVEIAELRKFGAYLDEASEYYDSDGARNDVLLREVVQLRERFAHMVDPETYRTSLLRCQALMEKCLTLLQQEKELKDVQALGAIGSDGTLVTKDQAVS